MKQEMSIIQRRGDNDKIFGSLHESFGIGIEANLYLKSSLSRNTETASIEIPCRVLVDAMKIIRNRQISDEQKSTAADVLENLQHENMKFQQEILALKNQIENMKLQQENLVLKNQLIIDGAGVAT